MEVHDKDWIEDQNMETFLMAAKGSCEPPVFLELTYCGGGSEKPVVLVGTGLTFDTGGIHLKKCHNMDKYRASVAGKIWNYLKHLCLETQNRRSNNA